MLPWVLAIQSHVVHGYVGNKCSTLPLQLGGLEVDSINSVQLSSHTHYDKFGGQVLKGDDLKVIYESLKATKTNCYDYLLSGYIGEESFLEELSNVVVDLKSSRPHLRYYCDPVLGDNGHFYVPEILLTIYKEKILPHADCICPNQFEAEQISGMKIQSETDAIHCLEYIQSTYDIPLVVISSVDALLSSDEWRHGFVIEKKFDGTIIKARFSIPNFKENFVGTGDLFAALLIVNYNKTSNLEKTLNNVCNTMYAVLKRTFEMKDQTRPNSDLCEYAKKELRIINSINDFLKPETISQVCKFQLL